MAACISARGWRTGMWLCFGIITFGVLLTVTFGEETFYPRHLPIDRVPVRKSRLLRLIGVEQFRTKWTTNTLLDGAKRPALTLTKLPVFLICVFYFFDCKKTLHL